MKPVRAPWWEFSQFKQTPANSPPQDRDTKTIVKQLGEAESHSNQKNFFLPQSIANTMESLHPDSNLKHFAYCINKALFNETIVGQQSLVSPGSWTQMLTIKFLKKLNICNELGSSSPSNLISMSNIYDIMSSLFVKSILFCVTEFNLFEYFCIYEYAKVFL